MGKPAKLLTLRSRQSSLAAPEVQNEQLAKVPLETEFHDALLKAELWPLQPTKTEILQLNLGKLCNQSCRHCHVDAGPDRREVMSREVMQQALALLERTPSIGTVDLTGGAPELNPDFRWLVESVRSLDRHVIDRCNLTIVETPSHRDLPKFFAKHRVEVVCSLPHYRPFNTDRQRGDGVFEKSLRALRKLNDVGYGDGRSGLRLVLVTNPVGAFLPAPQHSLEAEWKGEMARLYDIRFDALYTITNMPIARYLEWLLESGNLDGYMSRLVSSFNPAAARTVMCRNTLSVSWDGKLYDCDFNQMLEMTVDGSAPPQIGDISDIESLEERDIRVGRHCFGCTAGAGSSCGGAMA